jgi:hypothetical protein
MKFQGLIYAELRSLTDRGGLKGCPVSHVTKELDEDALGSEGFSIPVFSMVLYILFYQDTHRKSFPLALQNSQSSRDITELS